MPFSSKPNSYKGLALPNAGEARMKQVSTKDMLTLEHSSANAGRFFTFRDSLSSAGARGEGSTVASADLSYFDADGRFVGPVVKPVVTLTTVSQDLTSAHSGALLIVGECGTPAAYGLPKNPTPGTFYEVYVSSQDAAGDVSINSTNDSSAGVEMSAISTNAGTAEGISPGSTVGTHFVRITAISSVVWYAEPGYSFSTAGYGAWVIGTTVA